MEIEAHNIYLLGLFTGLCDDNMWQNYYCICTGMLSMVIYCFIYSLKLKYKLIS